MTDKSDRAKLRSIHDRMSAWGSDEFSQQYRMVPDVELQAVLATLRGLIGMDDEETVEAMQDIFDSEGGANE